MLITNKLNGSVVASDKATDFTFDYVAKTNQTRIFLGSKSVATITGELSKDEVYSFIDSIWNVEQSYFRDIDHIYSIIGLANGFIYNGDIIDNYTIYEKNSVIEDMKTNHYLVPIVSIQLPNVGIEFPEASFYRLSFNPLDFTLTSIKGDILEIILNDFNRKFLETSVLPQYL